jgi:hypothetical protein
VIFTIFGILMIFVTSPCNHFSNVYICNRTTTVILVLLHLVFYTLPMKKAREKKAVNDILKKAKEQ